MNVTVVYGFLGAGKTSLLRILVPRLTAIEKTAVLLNEFGALGIDQAVLQQDDILVREIAGGCICCEMRGDLLAVIERIAREIGPARLVIEPTGLVAPQTLEQVLGAPPLRDLMSVDSTITVLDASRLDVMRRLLGESFPQQARVADIVVINKTDLASPAQVEEARGWVRAHNPSAAIVTTAHARIDPDLVLAVIHDRAVNGGGGQDGKTGRRQDHAAAHRHVDSANGTDSAQPLSTLGLDQVVISTHAVSSQRLHAWASELAAGRFGEVVRAKGFVPQGQGSIYLDIVLGQIERRSFGPAPARIVVIGRDLRLADMEQALNNGSTQYAQATHS